MACICGPTRGRLQLLATNHVGGNGLPHVEKVCNAAVTEEQQLICNLREFFSAGLRSPTPPVIRVLIREDHKTKSRCLVAHASRVEYTEHGFAIGK